MAGLSPGTRIHQDDETAAICKFTRSPIDFLRMITNFRRFGQSYTSSHMGKILGGQLVRGMDFEVIDRAEEIDDPMDLDEDTIVVKPEPV
jgi:hypothetical protein